MNPALAEQLADTLGAERLAHDLGVRDPHELELWGADDVLGVVLAELVATRAMVERVDRFVTALVPLLESAAPVMQSLAQGGPGALLGLMGRRPSS